MDEQQKQAVEAAVQFTVLSDDLTMEDVKAARLTIALNHINNLLKLVEAQQAAIDALDREMVLVLKDRERARGEIVMLRTRYDDAQAAIEAASAEVVRLRTELDNANCAIEATSTDVSPVLVYCDYCRFPTIHYADICSKCGHLLPLPFEK